jgi:spore germination protein
MLIHVVKAGESLWRIANTYRVSMASIIDVNELTDPSRLVIGQALVIPEVREESVHTVKAGESLWRIAQTYGTTVQNITQANNITNPNLIYPGQRLTIPGKQKPSIAVNGYIYIYGQAAVPIVREVGEYLTYLSPFAYLIREDGSMQPIDDQPALEAGRNLGVVPMMSITNFTSTYRGENLASVVLNSPEIRGRLLNNILQVMREKGYRGLNVDFENVLPADREAYNTFLQEAVNRLHAEGYFVSSALAPKTSATQTGLLYEAHDYEAHGRIADFVVLMTYEWGYRKGPPQAISPLNQIRRVLDYAVTVIPRRKIYFGFQIYARDWLLPHVAGQEAETFSMQEAMARAVRYGTVIQYDTVTQSPFFRYRDERGRNHEVWFEDARSAQAKFDTVKEYNLGGISYWALGYPFPQNWALLRDNFRIQKL